MASYFGVQKCLFLNLKETSKKVDDFECIKYFKIFFGFAVLVRRRTKTQKYNGALFEQLESGWA